MIVLTLIAILLYQMKSSGHTVVSVLTSRLVLIIAFDFHRTSLLPHPRCDVVLEAGLEKQNWLCVLRIVMFIAALWIMNGFNCALPTYMPFIGLCILTIYFAIHYWRILTIKIIRKDLLCLFFYYVDKWILFPRLALLFVATSVP